MRAVGIKGGKGSADDLFIEDNVPDPIAHGDHVVVRIHLFGLNRMDLMQREAKYPYKLLPESGNILGVEFSGVVDAAGPDCTSQRTHDSLFSGLAQGSRSHSFFRQLGLQGGRQVLRPGLRGGCESAFFNQRHH